MLAAVQGLDPRYAETAIALGASPMQVMVRVLHEARFGVMAAVLSGFGRVISEVGCALMVGGNIEGETRTITTAIALETSKGEFAQGIALGIVLVAVVAFITAGHLEGKELAGSPLHRLCQIVFLGAVVWLMGHFVHRANLAKPDCPGCGGKMEDRGTPFRLGGEAWRVFRCPRCSAEFRIPGMRIR